MIIFGKIDFSANAIFLQVACTANCVGQLKNKFDGGIRANKE